jgi:hypothetical protein
LVKILKLFIMKKLLLSAFVVFAYSATAQTIYTENFNGMNLGNLSTAIDGETEGQNEWLTFATNGAAGTTANNADNSNFQVVASGFEGQALHVTSSNGNAGSRFVWRDEFEDLWDARTSGNDVINVEYHFFTGASSTSTTQNGMRLYGVDGETQRILGGFVYTPSTRILQAIQYLNNNGTINTFLVGLGASATAPIVLENDTWYRIGFSYNTITGAVIYSGPGFENVGLPAATITGPFPLLSCEIVSGTPNTNASAATVGYDNILFKASATSDLLSSENSFATANFSIYPNPATDVVNINAGNLVINSIQVTDLNGRVINTINVNASSTAQVSVADLMTGIYFLTVNTDQGVGTSKIVKK